MEQELIDTLVGAGVANIVMPRKEFMKEHKHLIGLLRKYRQHPELAKEAASQEAEMKSYTGGFTKSSGFIRRLMAENTVAHKGQYGNPTKLPKGSTMNRPAEFDYKKLANAEQKGTNTSAYGASPFIQKHFGTTERVPFERKRGTPPPLEPYPNKKRVKKQTTQTPTETPTLTPSSTPTPDMPPPPQSPPPPPVEAPPPPVAEVKPTPPPAPTPASNKIHLPLFNVRESQLFKTEEINDTTMEPFVKLYEALKEKPLLYFAATKGWVNSGKDMFVPIASTKPLLHGTIEEPGTPKKQVADWVVKMGLVNDEFKPGGLRSRMETEGNVYHQYKKQNVYINETGNRKGEKDIYIEDSTGKKWEVEHPPKLVNASGETTRYGAFENLRIEVSQGFSAPQITYHTYDLNLGKIAGAKYRRTRESLPGVMDLTPTYYNISFFHKEIEDYSVAFFLGWLYKTEKDKTKRNNDIHERITQLIEKPTLKMVINGVEWIMTD